jgi:hypothetical protein
MQLQSFYWVNLDYSVCKMISGGTLNKDIFRRNLEDSNLLLIADFAFGYLSL